MSTHDDEIRIEFFCQRGDLFRGRAGTDVQFYVLAISVKVPHQALQLLIVPVAGIGGRAWRHVGVIGFDDLNAMHVGASLGIQQGLFQTQQAGRGPIHPDHDDLRRLHSP